MESTIGGTRRHIVDLTLGLVREGVETTLVASAEREPAFRNDLRELEREGARVIELPMIRAVRPMTDFRHYRALKRILRETGPDVIHTHSSKAGVLGRKASLSTGIGKRVHTPHTFAFLFSAMFSARKRWMYRHIETRLGAQTDCLVAVSESEAQTIHSAQVVDPARVRVVPNGIDPAAWVKGPGLSREALGVPENAPLAVVAGLLNPAKGQDLAIRALVETGLSELQLLLAGHGDWRPELERLALELGVGDRVHFLGWRDDIPAIFRSVDLVLLPSRWEGMPYVVLEAGASAVPVVGTRVDGASELIREGETGFLADLESPEDLARAIRAFLDCSDQERRAMGVAAQERVLAEFGVEAMVQKMCAVYGELL